MQPTLEEEQWRQQQVEVLDIVTIVTFGFVLMSKTDTNVANVRIVIVNARIAQD